MHGSERLATAAIALALGVGSVGCGAKSPPTESRPETTASKYPAEREHARREAQASLDALIKEDYEQYVSRIHPAVVARDGGKEAVLAKMGRNPLAQAKAMGMTGEFRVIDPVRVEPGGGGDWFAVVPFRLTLTRGGESRSDQQFLVGVSRDNGTTWTFIDGTGSYATPSKLKELHPNFPPALELPR